MKIKQKTTFKQVEANGRVFTFCILRVGSSNHSNTNFSIGATVRSSEDSDNLKRDRNGVILRDANGNARMIDPNLPNIIAEGRAFKRPVFTFNVAYNIESSGRYGWPIADALIETIVKNPENFFAGYRTELIKKMKSQVSNVQNVQRIEVQPQTKKQSKKQIETVTTE